MNRYKVDACIYVLLASATLALLISFTSAPDHATEPLAEPTILSQLVTGHTLPIPREEYEAEFHGTPANPPSLASLTTLRRVLGISTDSTKRIEVNLTRQRVTALEGNRVAHEFVVSTGKWGWTPTGEFTIWAKVRSQLMKGGKKELGTYYYLPNVPYVMFFSNAVTPKMRGFSFHGTYWHNNFGTPMSHGCINMKTEDAKTLYEWATPMVTNLKAWSTPVTAENPGTKVIIYGKTPKS